MFYILQKNKLKLSTFEVTNPFETKGIIITMCIVDL